MSQPSTPSPMRLAAALLVSVSLAAVARAAELATLQVVFSPLAEAKFERYGKSEERVLQERIRDAVVKVCQASLPRGVSISVVVNDVAPTYPTSEQQDSDPSIDPVETHYLGGASLTGYVLGDHGQVLKTVSHRYFPPTIHWRSQVFEPWADADKAIGQFADQLKEACRSVHP